MQKTTGLSTLALVLLITGAIDNIRNLPTTALFGSSLIFFFIFSAIVFLIPIALVSAELSGTSKEKGGIYHWTYLAFGEKIAFLSVWLQWINTMVWFPTILSFIAGTATYFINPELAQNKFFLVTMILSVFWLMTFINLKGVHVSVKFANICSFVGMVLPLGLIIVLAIVWIFLGKPLQIHFTGSDLIPNLGQSNNWISLTAIMTAFLGIELATVHIKEVNTDKNRFPKALAISVVLILVTMILGALAIAIVLPKNDINLTVGVIQAFTNFFSAYHMGWMIPVITVMLLIGSLGGMTSWIISPAKGLLQAAESGFLPRYFTRYKNLLILQAILVTLICLAFLLMPSVNGSYWLLTALSTELYVLMYVLMFFAGIYLKRKLWPICLLGLIGCGITLLVGFIPPSGIDVGSKLHYEIVFSLGLLVMIAPVIFFYLYKARTALIYSTA